MLRRDFTKVLAMGGVGAALPREASADEPDGPFFRSVIPIAIRPDMVWADFDQGKLVLTAPDGCRDVLRDLVWETTMSFRVPMPRTWKGGRAFHRGWVHISGPQDGPDETSWATGSDPAVMLSEGGELWVMVACSQIDFEGKRYLYDPEAKRELPRGARSAY